MARSIHEKRFELLWVSLYPDVDLFSEYSAVQGWEDDYKARKLEASKLRAATGIRKRCCRYRADFAHIESKTLIECHGQIWRKGGHTTGKGILRDCRKSLLAATSGWLTVALAGEEMIDVEHLRIVKRVIDQRMQP